MISTTRSEAKYQMIKLIHSGRSLTEAKALLKSVSMGLDPEYADKGDVKDLASLEGGIHRLTMTRNEANSFAKAKFTPRKEFSSVREEHVARWATGYGGQGPISWKRDGNLIRRGKPNRPKPGSSAGKIGKTRVIGAKRTLKNFRRLITTLQRLMKAGKGGDTKSLQKAYKDVRTSVTIKGGKGG